MRPGLERIKGPAYSAGITTSEALRQGNAVAGYWLNITGSLVITGGSGAATLHASDELAYRLARRIRITGDNRDIVNVTGLGLRAIHKMYKPRLPFQTVPTATAAGTEAIDVWLYVPLRMPHTKHEDEFGFATGFYKTPTIFFDGAQGSELVYGTEDATSYVLTDMDIQLYEEPIRGIDRMAARALRTLVITDVRKPLLASVSNEPIWLDPFHKRGYELRSAIIETLANGSSATDYRYSSSVLDRLKLSINGLDEIGQVPADLIQQINAVEYDLSALETGLYVLDSAYDRVTRKGKLWTMNGEDKPYIEFDATKQSGENLVRVTLLGTRGRFLSNERL